MQLTDEQVEYFARICFVRGVMAERLGLLHESLQPLLGANDIYDIVDSLITLETIGDGLCAMAGRYA